MEKIRGLVINHKPISESSLKRLLLIFDEIYFINPDQNRFLIPAYVSKITLPNMVFEQAEYGMLYNGVKYQEEEELLIDKFDYALNKGIVQVLNLKNRKFYEENWLPLRLSYDYDTGNAELLNNFLQLTKKDKNFTCENGIMRGVFLSPSNIKIYPDIPPAISFYNERENELYNLDHQLWSITGKLNRSLAVCSEFSLIPIFLNENLAQAFSHKIEIAKSNKDIRLKSEFLKQHRTQLENVQYLLHRVSEIILPDGIVDKISVRELIYARNNTYHECIKLRRKLIKTISFLSETEFNDEFMDEVNKYIKMEVEPLIDEYQKKFIETIYQLLRISIPFGSSVLGSMIGIQQNLSPMAIAYLGGISGTVGTVSSELSQYILKNRTKAFNNTYSYFINLKE